jgi:glycosyltransferase involved in cell wall biosynthesis
LAQFYVVPFHNTMPTKGFSVATKSPHITVIIPAYNADRFLPQTLLSVQHQTYGDIEIVVVDDGSTDGSADIVRAVAHRDSRVRYVHQENLGVVWARNRGIASARGTMVAFLDADDLWLPEKLQQQLRFRDQHNLPASAVLGTLASYFGSRRGPVGTIGVPTDLIKLDAVRSGHLMPFVLSSLLMDKSTLEHLGGFSEDMSELALAQDLELMTRIAGSQLPLFCLNQRLVHYRLHRHSLSAQLHPRQKMAARYVRTRAESADMGVVASTVKEFARNYSPTLTQAAEDAVEARLRAAAVEYVDGSLWRSAKYLVWAIVKSPGYTFRRTRIKLSRR